MRIPRRPAPAEKPTTALLDRSRARVLWQQHSSSGHLLVAENERYRWLEFGDGVAQSAFALAQPQTLILPYTQWLLAGLMFTSPARNATVLGLGGGSVASFLARAGVQVTGVDADPLVVEAARRFFPLAPHGLELRLGDAREYIDNPGMESVDVLIIDLFTREGMPRWLAHAAFHDACAARLARGGVTCINLAMHSADALDDVLDAMRAAYGQQVLMLAVPQHANVIAIAVNGNHPDNKQPLQKRAQRLEQTLHLPFTRMLNALFAAHGTRGRLRFTATAASLGLC